MKARRQRQLIRKLLTDGRCDAAGILQVLGRTLYADSRLLAIFLAARSCYRTRGEIDPQFIHEWLLCDARSEYERSGLTDLFHELTEENSTLDN